MADFPAWPQEAHDENVSLSARIAELEAALEPFREFAEHAIDGDGSGWVWASNIHREGISAWFGPSDFGAVRATLPAKTSEAGK